jgi:CheY-like chemotaxis protein/nitrogen-specific signal transduction histidine kinase
MDGVVEILRVSSMTEHTAMADIAGMAAEIERLKAANCAKSAFLANMSHEIRTPLNAVLGYAQLMLRDSTLPMGAKENLTIISRSGEHLLALINDILDISKIEAGRMELNPEEFDAGELLRDLCAMFRPTAEAKGIGLEVRVEAPRGLLVADQGKLRQVLINLLSNAVKFTAQGAVGARVVVETGEEHDLWLSVEVSDTGVGIGAEDQERLFRPFVQTLSGVQAHTGTGLGLAISREFIRMMGGDIAVSSEPGKGSRFSFSIPVQAVAGHSSPAAPKTGRVTGLRPGGAAPRILIVDDKPHNRGWLNALLTTIGFEVAEADSGPAAIEQCRRRQPRLILMDLRMPGMDGLEAARAIRALEGQQPVVIALTASAMNVDRVTIARSGIDDFLPKPCREADLLDKLRTHLGIEYEYACAPASTADGPPAKPASLPPAHAAALREAVANGDKGRLDSLIGQLRELDARSASALQQLADGYEYDALEGWLVEAER